MQTEPAGPSRITWWGYLLILVGVAIGVVMLLLLLGYVSLISGNPNIPGLGVLLVIFLGLVGLAEQKWIVLAALSLAVAGAMVRARRRYLLIIVGLALWLAINLLNLVVRVDWLEDVFEACWLALLCLALVAPYHRRWRELAFSCAALLIGFNAFAFLVLASPGRGGLLPNSWLQEAGFHLYASYLIRPMPSEQFLSKCQLYDYMEEDGTKQQVGLCDDGLRSMMNFKMALLYDPSGQLGLPPIQRTLAWRLAMLHLPDMRPFIHDDRARHLVGNFYWVVARGFL